MGEVLYKNIKKQKPILRKCREIEGFGQNPGSRQVQVQQHKSSISTNYNIVAIIDNNSNNISLL